MNDPILLRIVWKEYRQLRAFWLVTVAFTVFLQGATLVVSLSTGQRVPIDEMFGMGVILPVLYALGCGAMLFAGEHESHTYDFQRALPLDVSRLMLGKLGAGIVSVLLLLPALLLSAWLLSGCRIPVGEGGWLIGVVGAIVALELFAWSVLWSLLLGRVLWAVVLTSFCAILTAFAAVPLLGSVIRGLVPRSIDVIPEPIPLLALAGIVLLLADVGLGRRWLREYPLPWNRPRRERLRAQPAARWSTTSSVAVWSRLIWQAWMQSRVTLCLILGFSVLVSLLFIVHAVFFMWGPSQAFRLPLIFAPGVAAFIGSTIFWSDQRNGQYLFLAERGVSPRRIWASRQVVGLASVAAYCLFALLCLAGDAMNSRSPFHVERIFAGSEAWNPQAYQITHEALSYVIALVGLSVVLYTVGQACSLMIRSGPVALFVGLMCGWLIWMWAGAMWFLEVPLWFSVVPVPLTMFWASWLRAPDWINGRASWRRRWKMILSVGVPLAAVVAAMMAYRVYEIPSEQPFTADELDRIPSQAALETAGEYCEIYQDFMAAMPEESTTDDPQTEAAVEAMAPRFLKTARRPDCLLPTVQTYEYLSRQGVAMQINAGAFAEILADNVLLSCDRLEREGRLDDSLERYLAVLAFSRQYRHRGDWQRQWRADMIEANVFDGLTKWAASPAQTADAIRAALQRLDAEHLAHPVPRRDCILGDYMWCRDAYDLQDAAVHAHTANEAFALWFSARFLPWEHARLGRLLDATTANELQRLLDIQRCLDHGSSVYEADFNSQQRQLGRWLNTTPLFFGGNLSGSSLQRILGQCEARRRIVRLQLGLAAWRWEHGDLPDNLEQLHDPQARYQHAMTDPFTGVRFLYRPQGVSQPVTIRSDPGIEMRSGEKSEERTLEPGAPFLWSAGPLITYHARSSALKLPREANFADFIYRPSGATTAYEIASEEELWSLGQCYPLPESGL